MAGLEKPSDKYDGDNEEELISVNGSLMKRKFRNGLILAFKYLKDAYKNDTTTVLSSGKPCSRGLTYTDCRLKYSDWAL